MIFERHANLKYKYGIRHFWCIGYYVDTVGKNAKKIEEYIRNQLKEDLEYDQMTLKEYIDYIILTMVNIFILIIQVKKIILIIMDGIMKV